MGKGLPRSMSRGKATKQELIKHTIVLDALAMEVDGASGVGFGSAVAGGLPEGNVVILGAVAYLSFAGPGGSASLDETWAGDFGVGTTPAGDATLTGADVDIIASTELAAATAEVSPRTRGTLAVAGAGAVLDNTDGSLEVNVSLLVDDANIGADGLAFTVTGEIHLLLSVLGDD